MSTNSTGSLSWVDQSSVAADSLDFDDLVDEMTLDADTSVNGDQSFVIRTGRGASQYTGSGANDLHLAAEDAVTLSAGDFTLTVSEDATYPLILRSSSGGIQLSTGSSDNGNLTLYSSGTLMLDTSLNNTPIVLDAGTNAVTLPGSAEGTTALSLTAGDLVLTDGDLTLSGGDLSVTGATATLDLTGAISFDSDSTASLGAAGITLTSDADTATSLAIRSVSGGIELSTGRQGTSGNEYLRLLSAGSLQLDTSATNSNVLVRAGTGRFDVSSGTMLLHSGTSNLTLSSEGTVTIGAGTLVLSNLTSCSGLGNGGALTTDASGLVSCAADDSGGTSTFTDDGTYIYPTNSARRFIYNYEGVPTTVGFFEASGDEDIIMRAGLGASEYNLSGNHDL